MEGIAAHIRKFWEPRMRHALLSLLDEGAAGVSPIVREALGRHRALLA